MEGSGGFASVELAVEAIARGGMVVVVDDPARENEGDLVMAAQHATAQAVNFMAVHARGLICMPLPAERLAELHIPLMAARHRDAHGTAFCISVDARAGTTTGISAPDRAATIRALADPAAVATDFRRPGHIFPLAARDGGVLERPGHTEASIELARRAGAAPAAVICEIACDDGEMMRCPELLEFAAEHGLPVLAISDLIAYVEHERGVHVRALLREAMRCPEEWLDSPEGLAA